MPSTPVSDELKAELDKAFASILKTAKQNVTVTHKGKKYLYVISLKIWVLHSKQTERSTPKTQPRTPLPRREPTPRPSPTPEPEPEPSPKPTPLPPPKDTPSPKPPQQADSVSTTTDPPRAESPAPQTKQKGPDKYDLNSALVAIHSKNYDRAIKIITEHIEMYGPSRPTKKRHPSMYILYASKLMKRIKKKSKVAEQEVRVEMASIAYQNVKEELEARSAKVPPKDYPKVVIDDLVEAAKLDEIEPEARRQADLKKEAKLNAPIPDETE
jgi:hypothetical protein